MPSAVSGEGSVGEGGIVETWDRKSQSPVRGPRSSDYPRAVHRWALKGEMEVGAARPRGEHHGVLSYSTLHLCGRSQDPGVHWSVQKAPPCLPPARVCKCAQGWGTAPSGKGLGHPEVDRRLGCSSGVWCLPSVCKALGSIPSAAKKKKFVFSRTEVGLLPLCSPWQGLALTNLSTNPGYCPPVCPYPAKDCHFSFHLCHHQRWRRWCWVLRAPPTSPNSLSGARLELGVLTRGTRDHHLCCHQ